MLTVSENGVEINYPASFGFYYLLQLPFGVGVTWKYIAVSRYNFVKRHNSVIKCIVILQVRVNCIIREMYVINIINILD